MGNNVHVVPKDNGWAVKQAGSPFPLSQHNTQAAAIVAGRSWAQINQSELVIHRPDGTIRDKDSYGSDPFPPRDLKH